MLVTTCPDCDTTFKLTVAILEKAGGQVRCGRCGRIFDANTRLREQPEAGTERLPDATPQPDVARSTGAMGSRWYLRDDPSQDGADEAAAGLTPTDSDALGVTAAEVTAAEVTALEVFALEGDAVESATGEADAAGPDSSPEAPTDGAGAAKASTAAERPLDSPPLFLPAPEARASESSQASPVPSGTDWRDTPDLPARRRTWPWAVAAGVLIVTLAAQLIHAARADLAGVPTVGPWLISAYGLLGRDLAPPVALDQYSTIDLTAAAEPVTDDLGWLIIETRVQNRGPKVQPFPHILIRLLDRWQATIAGRYFSPEEYLVAEQGDYSRMDVGTTVDAQFIIVDPGANATGFELEFCTPVGSGYRCDAQQ